MTPRRIPTLSTWLALALCLAMQAPARPETAPRFAGRPLTEVLDELRADGSRIVYSSRLVGDDLRVDREPVSTTTRALLLEVLWPHGLTVRDMPGDRLVVVRRRPSAAEEDASRGPVTVSEVIVVTSEEPGDDLQPPSATLDRDDALLAPYRESDLGGALRGLPGVTTDGFAASLLVRGGFDDEVMVVVDGQEVVRPYHLPDLGGSRSIVSTSAVKTVALRTSGWSPAYGDRMSGVLELTTVDPGAETRTTGAIDLESTRAASSGTFLDDRAGWFATARRGRPEIASELGEFDEKPVFWDAFGKVFVHLGARHDLEARLLWAHDGFDFADANADTFVTKSENTSLWLTHRAVLGSRWWAESRASRSVVLRDRFGVEVDDGFLINDERRLEWVGAEHRESWSLGERHELTLGAEARHLSVTHTYVDQLTVQPTGDGIFSADLEGDHLSAHVADRWRPTPSVAAEAGLRWDRATLTDDSLWSPRLALVARAGKSTFRAAWSRVHQTHRPDELQVPDGETDLQPAERSEHRVAGFERRLGAVELTVEAYERRIRSPRVRFENLFKPFSRFPETEIDRVGVAPLRGEARGLELTLRGRHGRHLDWRAGYAFARILDTLADETGERDVPRRHDQPHGLRLDLGFSIPRDWRIQLTWTGHTGWPTTAFEGRGEDGSLVLGPLRGERLDDYHRLDVDASREWRVRRWSFRVHAGIENLYDRRNQRGFDVGGDVVTPEVGRGLSPRLGLAVEF